MKLHSKMLFLVLLSLPSISYSGDGAWEAVSHAVADYDEGGGGDLACPGSDLSWTGCRTCSSTSYIYLRRQDPVGLSTTRGDRGRFFEAAAAMQRFISSDTVVRERTPRALRSSGSRATRLCLKSAFSAARCRFVVDLNI
jgi:hypothetical protein